MRVVTISDSDSYLKWACATFESVDESWQVQHLVVQNVIAPSDAQIAAVDSSRPVTRKSLLGVLAAVSRMQPQVIVLAMTGPALEVVQGALAYTGLLGPRNGRPRPVLMGGLPGISFPANDLAIRHRRHLDLMVLHSHREVEAYRQVVERLGGPRVGLASLPFLDETIRSGGDLVAGGQALRQSELRQSDQRGHTGVDRADVVFAAQSLVPPAESDRVHILQALSEIPAGLDPVVKVRAQGSERQAHNEKLPYRQLAEKLAPSARERLAFRAGSMQAALRTAAGFVTVSSTAALEAISAGVPVLVLDDFGVNAEMINLVFVGSGLLGDLDDLRAGRFHTPDPRWLENNYFHPAEQNDWSAQLERLVAHADELPPVRFRGLGGPAQRVRRLLRMH